MTYTRTVLRLVYAHSTTHSSYTYMSTYMTYDYPPPDNDCPQSPKSQKQRGQRKKEKKWYIQTFK